jgi:hypothetical protein
MTRVALVRMAGSLALAPGAAASLNRAGGAMSPIAR